MSPVLILSRLCLNRRFQFFGISEHFVAESTSSTFLTVSSSITRAGRPAAAFSVGTITVMSLWRILIVRYSRCLAEDLHVLLVDDLTGTVVGIDDLITDLELDVLDFTGDLELLEIVASSNGLFGNGVLLSVRRPLSVIGQIVRVCR